MASKRNRSGGGTNGAGGTGPRASSELLKQKGALDRRDFLKVLGMSMSAVASGCEVFPSDKSVGAVGSIESALGDSDLPIDYSLSAIRRDDFVLLRFDFINFMPHPD